MEPLNLPLITSAVAPVVMVSAAGLLFIGMQTKNLHLADRIRGLTAEYRLLPAGGDGAERRDQIVQQLRLFEARIRLSQRALELVYLAIVCFVLTSLALAAAGWGASRALTISSAVIFVSGVALLLAALVVEYLELRVGLRTIGLEVRARLGARARASSTAGSDPNNLNNV